MKILLKKRRSEFLGMSVMLVFGINGCMIHIKGLDMLDGKPFLDVKPARKLK